MMKPKMKIYYDSNGKKTVRYEGAQPEGTSETPGAPVRRKATAESTGGHESPPELYGEMGTIS